MALPIGVLPGFSASLYAQPGATPTVLTLAQLSMVASVSPIAVQGNLVPAQAIPTFGLDDAVATYPIAGSRQGDKIPVQATPTSMTIVCTFNAADTFIGTTGLLRADANSGVVDRTFVIAFVQGANIAYYAFNARVGAINQDPAPNAEAKATFVLHPRGGLYGWSNNA